MLTGASKPSFLIDPALPIFRVSADGGLANVEMGSGAAAAAALRRGKVFQGGNFDHLHAMLKLRTRAGLLYASRCHHICNHICNHTWDHIWDRVCTPRDRG